MDFAAGVYLSEAHKPIPPPPPYTLYTFVQYTYLHREGGSGESLNRREVRGAISSQSWVENTIMTDCSSSL
jgi:hypothetical protein